MITWHRVESVTTVVEYRIYFCYSYIIPDIRAQFFSLLAGKVQSVLTFSLSRVIVGAPLD